MADNVTADAGTGGATFAADDISGVHYPRTKLIIGADGTNDGDVSSANPLPVTNGGLTELAAAINSSKVDVNLASTAIGMVVTNAGTFAVQVDGAALTALQLIDDAVYVDDADWTDDTSKHFLVGGVYQATPHTVTDGDVTPFLTDANGRLGVSVGNTVTVASHAVTNAGTFAVQVDGAALTALQLIDDCVYTDDAGFTPATSKLLVIGGQADDASTDSVDEGDAGALRMTLDRKLVVNPQPHTVGGLSIFRSIDLDEGTLEVVKNAPGCVYGMWVTNTATATRWIKFYDATSGTAGTGTPVITIGIPGNSSDDIAAVIGGTHGIMFGTGICVGATTGVADNDTGAPGANDIVINIFYK